MSDETVQFFKSRYVEETQAESVNPCPVAICTPMYNSEPFLEKYLQAILQLDYPRDLLSLNFTVQGDDRTFDILKEFKSEFSHMYRGIRIEKIALITDEYLPHIQNVVHCRNLLAKWTAPDPVFFIDHDNFPPPETLKTLLQDLQTGASIAAGVYLFYKRDRKRPDLPGMMNFTAFFLINGEMGAAGLSSSGMEGILPEEIFTKQLWVDAVAMGSTLMTRKILDEHQFIIPEGRIMSDDTAYCLQAGRTGHRFIADFNLLIPHWGYDIHFTSLEGSGLVHLKASISENMSQRRQKMHEDGIYITEIALKPKADDIQEKFHSACLFHRNGEIDKAEDLCRRILDKMPDHADTVQLLGCILFQRGIINEGIVHLSRSTELSPENPLFFNNLGMALKESGQIDESIAIFRRALDLRPDSAEIHHNLGSAFQALGRLKAAASCYGQALDIEPDHFPSHKALSDINLPGEDYISILTRIHHWLKPATYLEIGVQSGRSLALAQPPTIALGIDPEPRITHEFNALTKIYPMTSDAFFESHNPQKEMDNQAIKLAFIDGLHLFEQVLKDFINIEKNMLKQSVILIHDCLPLDERTSARTRDTKFWSGDSWKMILCLKKYRPDLKVSAIKTPPTGLGIVTNLDPGSTVLEENFDKIIRDFIPLDFNHLKQNYDTTLNAAPNDWAWIRRQMEGAKTI